MSTTTNFKRIALVAVAALGLGVLSSVPSTAAINADTLTLSSATASQTTAETYTATAATVTVSFFGAAGDSMSITSALTAAPAGNTALPVLQLIETSSAVIDTDTLSARVSGVNDTFTANSAVNVQAQSSSVVTTAKFAVYLTKTNGVTAPSVAGTYGVKITPATVGASGALQSATAVNLTITVSTAASQSTTPDVASSAVYLQKVGANAAHTPVADSAIVVSKEVSATPAGWVYYSSKNAAGGAVSESITAEISGQGTLGIGGSNSPISSGRSISVRNGDTVTIWSDGSAGKGTITIKGSTSGVTLGTKTVTFTGGTASFTAKTAKEILLVSSNSGAVTFTAADSAGNVLNDEFTPAGGTQETWYAFSSDTTIATVGTLNYATDSGTVSVTGVKAGTATITIGNASTLAASTIKSNAVTVRVGSTAVASVTVAFDKATYAPGEKAIITLSLKDAAGLPVAPTATAYELWTSTGQLATDIAFTNSTSITSETSVALASTTVAGTSTAGAKTYVVYMPAVAGKVTISGTLTTNALSTRTLLTAAAIQGTTVSTSATVTDSGSAALAAVTALATTVASLKTLIVTLTNLVLKIQKKVKA